MAFSSAAIYGYAAAATVAATAYSTDQSRKAGNRSANLAEKQAKDQEQQFNKLNGKMPDAMAMMDQNIQAGKNGPSGTMLTGPQGIDPSKLTLGRNTLLGG